MFLFPIISAVMLLLMMAIPYLDPLKSNIAKFLDYYYTFLLVISAFFLYILLIAILGGSFSLFIRI